MPRINTTDVNKLLAKGMAALKPCPCCGSQASIETYDYLTVTLSCNEPKCKLKLMRYVLLPGQTIRWCIESVVKAWNKRTLPRSSEHESDNRGRGHNTRQGNPKAG